MSYSSSDSDSEVDLSNLHISDHSDSDVKPSKKSKKASKKVKVLKAVKAPKKSKKAPVLSESDSSDSEPETPPRKSKSRESRESRKSKHAVADGHKAHEKVPRGATSKDGPRCGAPTKTGGQCQNKQGACRFH